MSKVSVAIGSFVLGVFTSMALFTLPTHGRAASLGEQEPSVKGVTVRSTPGANVKTMIGPDLSPKIPGLGMLLDHTTLSNGTQILDGLNCDGCIFENADLRYSGGAIRLHNASFRGTTRVHLEGAAANTLALLPLLNAIDNGEPLASPAPNVAITKTATSKGPTAPRSWQAPYVSQGGFTHEKQ